MRENLSAPASGEPVASGCLFSSPEKQRRWSEGGTQSLKCYRVIHDETCIDLDLKRRGCGLSETVVLQLGSGGVGGPVLKGASPMYLQC